MKKVNKISIAKALISLAFIIIVFYKIEIDNFSNLFYEINIFFLVLFFLLMPVMIFVSTLKWKILLRALNVNIPMKRLIILYQFGILFNNVLPSSVGGDVIVTYELSSVSKKVPESIVSVFMNRFTGLLVLLPASFFSLIYMHSLNYIIFKLALILLLIASIIVFILMYDNRSLLILERYITFSFVQTGVRKFHKIQNALTLYRHKKMDIVLSLILSVIFFFLMIINIYLGCLSFNFTPHILGILVILPFIQIISMLPISFGGIGLQEWTYIVTFPLIGLNVSLGVAVSLLLRLKSIISGIIGGLLYIFVLKAGSKKIVKYNV